MRSNSIHVSPKQRRIAELARRSPEMSFTSLAYLMDLNWLYEAYRQTRKDGAAGVDGVVAAEYERNLEGNLQALLERAKSAAIVLLRSGEFTFLKETLKQSSARWTSRRWRTRSFSVRS